MVVGFLSSFLLIALFIQFALVICATPVFQFRTCLVANTAIAVDRSD